MSHGYSEEAVAQVRACLWLNANTKLVNGEHCLEYDAFAPGITEKGYARPTIDGKRRVYAHRLMLSVHLGRPIPTDKLVLHGCDNRLCCNPAHLVEGTVLENNVDRDSKGRNHTGYAKGRKHMSRAKATEIILAMSIAKHWDESLASRFGVSSDAIAHIRRGRAWGWLRQELVPQIEAARKTLKAGAASSVNSTSSTV